MGERERVALLRRVLAPRGAAPEALQLGIGDDCAVLGGASDDLVLSVDAIVEGVHFRRDMLATEDIGYRATMGALSDLAAMGARPVGVLSALVLPADVDDDTLEALARGQAEACAELGTAVVGGNLARGGELSISTTVVGRSSRPLRRDGAEPGHGVWVAGPLGLAAVGLKVLLDAPGRAAEAALRPAVAAWRRPRAQIEAGLRLTDVATAAIDLSDGLSLDLSRVAEASGCRIVLEEAVIAQPELVAACAVLGLDPVQTALDGGEDYAVVATAPDGVELEGFRRLGRCEPGDAAVVVEDDEGRRRTVAAGGWDHFADPS